MGKVACCQRPLAQGASCPRTFLIALRQRSPAFLAPGTGFVEDSCSTDGVGVGDGSGGNASDGERGWGWGAVGSMGGGGERQMKLRSLARCSPPAARPSS